MFAPVALDGDRRTAAQCSKRIARMEFNMTADAYDAIVTRFVNGDAPDQKLFNKTKVREGGLHGGGANSHGFTASPGTCRMSYGNGVLFSYDRWPIATRITNRDGRVTMIVVNGDKGPTKKTAEHQACLRRQLGNVPHAYLPMSALNSANIAATDVADLVIVATTPDREVEREARRKNYETGLMETKLYKEHFLGEVLFRHNGRLYVSGLDRNDDPARRNFYLARLPAEAKAKTVDEALRALRPKGLPSDATRQGEWFLVKAKTPQGDVHTSTDFSGKGVPILSADAEDMRRALDPTQRQAWMWRGRSDRHVATRMALDDDKVLVSGMLRDRQHGPMKLGNGKEWFRVVRNLADGSWGANGDVD